MWLVLAAQCGMGEVTCSEESWRVYLYTYYRFIKLFVLPR